MQQACKSRIEKIRLLKPQAIVGQCPLDPEHGTLAGSLGTPHVSSITSINKDKVPPIRVYVSSISQMKLRQMHQTQKMP
jgi:hypothetical protein